MAGEFRGIKEKVISGLERACFKRPVPESELLCVADEVEEEAFQRL